jgi:hypothetical protein
LGLGFILVVLACKFLSNNLSKPKESGDNVQNNLLVKYQQKFAVKLLFCNNRLYLHNEILKVW